MGIVCLSYLGLFGRFRFVFFFFSFCCSVWWWRVEEDRKGGEAKSIEIPCFAFFPELSRSGFFGFPFPFCFITFINFIN